MMVTCRNCHAQFELSADLIPPGGRRKVRCAYCRTTFHVESPEASPPIYDYERGGSPDETLDIGDEEPATMLLNLRNKPRGNTASQPAGRHNVLPEQYLPLSVADEGAARPAALSASPEGPGEVGEETMPPEMGGAQVAAPIVRLRLSDNHKAGMLNRSGWFTPFSWEELRQLAQYWEVVRTTRETAIFRRGDRTPYLGVILEGRVRLLAPGGSRDPGGHTLATLGPGQSMGEYSLFAARERAVTAWADQETWLLLLTRKRFHQLARHHPPYWQKIALKVAELLVERLAERQAPQLEALCLPLSGGDSGTP